MMERWFGPLVFVPQAPSSASGPKGRFSTYGVRGAETITRPAGAGRISGG